MIVQNKKQTATMVLCKFVATGLALVLACAFLGTLVRVWIPYFRTHYKVQRERWNVDVGNMLPRDSVDNNLYDRAAKDWNDKDGFAQGLHALQPLRVQYIQQVLEEQLLELIAKRHARVRWVSLGCGSGMVEEQIMTHFHNLLTRTKYPIFVEMLAFDLSEPSIAYARQHSIACQNATYSMCSLTYDVASIYNEVAPQLLESADAVLIIDVLDHLHNIPLAMDRVNQWLTKLPHRTVIFETIDRSLTSLLFVKLLAEWFEYIPRQTHDWRLFLQPKEVRNLLHNHVGTAVQQVRGMDVQVQRRTRPLTEQRQFESSWSKYVHSWLELGTSTWSTSISCNYVGYAKGNDAKK